MIRIWQGFGEKWLYRGKMTPTQVGKHSALVADGLSPVMAREFIWYKFGEAYMRRFRSAIRRGLVDEGNAWAIFRTYYDDAVARGRLRMPGGYTPPERPSVKGSHHAVGEGTGWRTKGKTSKGKQTRYAKMEKILEAVRRGDKAQVRLLEADLLKYDQSLLGYR